MQDSRVSVGTDVSALIDGIAEHRHVPRGTYRLQFNRSFTFRDALALIPYLNDLGISDCYLSPIFKPRSNSSHGYDISDHSRLNPSLGSAEDFDAFASKLRERDMGLILDVVPNHMGINDTSNIWWMDVLENGPSSIYASYFDIDWRPVKPELQNKVLLPILEDQYGKVLEDGKLRLTYDEGAFFILYYDVRLPVAPCTYDSILKHQLGILAQALGDEDDNEHVRELKSILTALSYLPQRTELDSEKIAERNREKEVIKGRIAALYKASADVRANIDLAVETFNGTIGDPRSFDMLDKLLEEQPYRPAFWRVAAEEINYRRFFDINELAAIHMELPEVFKATHQLVFRLLAEGKATGLRIDHPDGLWNPYKYFRLLQESYILAKVQGCPGLECSQDEVREAVSKWFQNQTGKRSTSPFRWPLYVVAEKILSSGERVPESWPVDGTTGYDFLNAVNGIFVDSRNHKLFDSIYSRFAGKETSFPNLTNSTKKMIMLISLASEINALGHQLERIAEKNRRYRDFTLNSLIFAIREVIAALPVYRTYVTGQDSVGRQDRRSIETAVTEAKKRNPRTAEAIFDFIRDSLLLRNLQDFSDEDQQPLIDLVMKFQQITGPVMGKGVEDTAFYVYNRLVSLNEVGGHPERFGRPVSAFHKQNVERHRRWPQSLLATSTHDTKRSEDVRARINVLSEIPEEWKAALTRWGQLNGSKKTLVDGERAPDRNDEYLLYQTLIGTWPDEPLSAEEFAHYRERIAAYMQKATKEAKVHTSWVNANEQYDTAVQDFVRRLLTHERDDPFVDDLLALQRRVAYYGRYNALSQTLLKLTSPGVPDIYQGTELWDYSLVDPDNRRPVDYLRRQTMLADLKSSLHHSDQSLAALANQLLSTSEDGRIKLYLIYLALNYRREHHELFSQGRYIPLSAHGEAEEHVCSFARVLGEETVLVVAPRLVVGLTGGIQMRPIGSQIWQDTHLILPRDDVGRTYRNLFTEERLSSIDASNDIPSLLLADVCAHFPVALLERVRK